MLLGKVINLPPDICHHALAQELQPLRSVCTSPHKRGVAGLPLLALFSQNETNEIKPFTHNSFQRLAHLARNGLRIVNFEEQLQAPEIHLNGQKIGKEKKVGQVSDLFS